MRQLPSAPADRATASLSRAQRTSTTRMPPTIPGTMSSSAIPSMAGICGTPFCCSSPRTTISWRRTPSSAAILDAIDLHGEGEYLNEIRDNTVIGGQRAGIALGNSGGSKNKHDASGPGNWVHSNDLIGNRQGVLVILGTPDTLIEDNRITAGEDSKVGIEVRNAPGTELHGNHITGGTDEFWAIRLNEDRGADGRGKGIPSGIRIKCNVIRQAANGIRIDAGKNLSIVENVFDGIDGAELRVADGIEVSKYCP